MDILRKISDCNITWNSPSGSERGFMPLGNGNLCMNLWVEKEGDLQFYFTVQDALTELDRNVKLGKVRLSLEPNPFKGCVSFCQTLNLADGCIDVRAQGSGVTLTLKIFAAENDVLFVDAHSSSPLGVRAAYTNWRTAPTSNCPPEVLPGERCEESADTVLDEADAVVFYHKNGLPCIRWCLRHVGLAGHENEVHDLLTNRIFGGRMTLTGAHAAGGHTLAVQNAADFTLRISTASEQTPDTEGFLRRLAGRDGEDPAEAFAQSAAAWNRYWQQSYVFVENDTAVPPACTAEFDGWDFDRYDDGPRPASAVTEAYVLTKFMFHSNAGGTFPLRYNGLNYLGCPAGGKPFDFSRFVYSLCGRPAAEPTPESNPDQRPWGDFTLWQNVRHPYFSMLARGEYRELKTLFDFYMAFAAINRAQARHYYGAEGQYNTEITMSFGTPNPEVYGLDRTGLPDGYSANRWGGAVDLSPGLELCCLMLDYCGYTQDTAYLNGTVLPYAEDLMRCITTRFPGRKDGKIELRPLHAVETYWDTLDPVTVVCGMQAVLERCIPLSSGSRRAFFEEVKRITPEPAAETADGKRVLAPAREYDPERHNVEPVEYYALFPFRYLGLGRPEPELAENTYESVKRFGVFEPAVIGTAPGAPSFSGWQYTGEAAARVQKREDVRRILQCNASLTNKAYRFPAMWGPVYDSVPDVNHGANLLTTLQMALLQSEGDKIYLLPALPEDWNVSFRLFAPQNTCIEAVYRGGRLEELAVSPEGRKKDIVLCVKPQD